MWQQRSGADVWACCRLKFFHRCVRTCFLTRRAHLLCSRGATWESRFKIPRTKSALILTFFSRAVVRKWAAECQLQETTFPGLSHRKPRQPASCSQMPFSPRVPVCFRAAFKFAANSRFFSLFIHGASFIWKYTLRSLKGDPWRSLLTLCR